MSRPAAATVELTLTLTLQPASWRDAVPGAMLLTAMPPTGLRGYAGVPDAAASLSTTVIIAVLPVLLLLGSWQPPGAAGISSQHVLFEAHCAARAEMASPRSCAAHLLARATVVQPLWLTTAPPPPGLPHPPCTGVETALAAPSPRRGAAEAVASMLPPQLAAPSLPAYVFAYSAAVGTCGGLVHSAPAALEGA